ncbi:MAG: Uma2 family endonuclease [Bryobacteraceae bacterium]
MSTGMLVSVEEYLNTTYRPDRDYVGGELLERTVGEYDHSRLQALITGILLAHEALWRTRTLPEQRVQVTRERFRVPDLCVIRKGTEEQIITRPPVVCIEIMSKDDTARALEERIQDYLQFGVPTVWLIDPKTRRAFVYTPDGVRREAADGVLRAANPEHPEIEIALSALFE